jgi:hypothetical protein
MRFGRKVDHRINVELIKNIYQQLTITNISVNEMISRMIFYILQITGIDQQIIVNNPYLQDET